MHTAASADTTDDVTPSSPEPSPAYRARTHYGSSALAATGDAFDSLARAEGAPVCARRDWLSIWLTAHPRWKPFVVEVRGAGGAAAGVAVLVRRRRWGVTDVVLAGSGDSDVACIPVSGPDAAVALVDAITAELRGIGRAWRLELEQVPAASPVPELLVRRLRYAVAETGDPVPRTDIGDDRSLAGYLSQRFRKETRRRRRRFEEAHAVDVEFLRDPADVASLAEAVAGLRRERDHDLSRPSTIDTDAGAAFWHGVVDHFGAAGQLELAVLRADGRLAAYVISIVETRVDGTVAYRGWDGRIATEFARFAPGQILDVAVLEHALEQADVVLVDYGRGDQEQKMHYANGVDETVAVHAWSSPWLRRWDAGLAAIVSKLRSFKEDHPGLERRWRAAKRVALRVRG